MRLFITLMTMLLFVDLVCNAIGSSMNFNLYSFFILLGIQLIVMIGHLIIIYIIISKTIMFTSGLIFQAFFKLVKIPLIVFLIQLALLGGTSGFKVVSNLLLP